MNSSHNKDMKDEEGHINADLGLGDRLIVHNKLRKGYCKIYGREMDIYIKFCVMPKFN